MALLTQVLVYSFCIILAECHLHFTHHIREPHHQRIHPEDPIFGMIADLKHFYEKLHQSDVMEDLNQTDDYTSRTSLLNESHTGEIDNIDKKNVDLTENLMNPVLETRDDKTDGATEMITKQHVKRASNKSESEEKPPLEDLLDEDKDPHAIKYPEPQVELKTNLDNNSDANANKTDGKNDTILSKNSDFLLIPIAPNYNPSLSFSSRFKNDETPGNPNTQVSPQFSNAGVNNYQQSPLIDTNVQGPVENPDTYVQNSYNPSQGSVYGNQPINQIDNTVSEIPPLAPTNNVPNSVDNNMGNKPPYYTLVNVPNNLDPQGIPSNQYYVLTNPQQNNQAFNLPPNYNLVNLNNQPNNIVPPNNQPNNIVPPNNQPNNMVYLYNQPNNNNMVPLYNNQPNNMIPVYNNQPNNMVPVNNQPNNIIYLQNPPNNMFPSNNQPYNFVALNNQPNGFPASSNVYPNYGGMNNQPNNQMYLNPQNNQPSNSGNYNGYGNQPNNFVPINKQPSYLVHLDNLPNNAVPINNQPNNMVNYPNPNQPTYWLVNNQPNNQGYYGNQPNNGNPIMLQPASNNIPIYSMKDEVESGDDKEPTDKQ